MEFREFTNPESEDYDIKSGYSYDEPQNETTVNPYSEQLIDLIGILEDITAEELQEQYGISPNEYYHPTAETIRKVKIKLGSEVQPGGRKL